MASTTLKPQKAPEPSTPVAPPVPISGTQPVLKCRCGALYLNPDAHHGSFGHRPEPVAASGACAGPAASATRCGTTGSPPPKCEPPAAPNGNA